MSTWPDAWPALDFSLSAYTGWTRAHWEAVLARMTYGFVLAAERSGSPSRALFPDDRRGQPDVVDGLEAFARLSVAWGAWLHNPRNPAAVSFQGRSLDLESLLCQGLVDGTDPGNPRTYWGDIGHMDQRIVETSFLAIALWLSRERVFQRLPPSRQQQVIAWLAQVDGKGTYPDNWILFPVFSQCVRLRLGYPAPVDDIDSRLEQMAAFYRGDGWYADGFGHEYDLYNAWMFGFHYVLWAWIDGQRRPDESRQVLERARSFLAGYAHFFGGNGAYVAWGRSLYSRFAAVAPFAVGHLLNIAPPDPGLLRRLSSGCLRYFVERGMFDPLAHHVVQGHFGNFPPAGESYMSPGSPYSASHGLFALALDAGDPFWTAPEAPLPVERGDFERVFQAPGFVVSGRQATGQVLLANGRSGHHSDVPRHNYPPKYGKFVYSSHFPFNVVPVGNSYAPDAMLALTADGQSFGHRVVTREGGAAPGVIWCNFDQLVSDEPQAVRAAILFWRDLQVAVALLRPTLPVMALQAPGALGCERPMSITRRSDPAAGWEYAEAEGRAVGIRRLLGYEAQRPSAPFLGQSNLNLAYPYAEQPLVAEARPSVLVRSLAAACLLRPAAFDPAQEFAGLAVAARPQPAGSFDVQLPQGECAFVALGDRLPSALDMGAATFAGPAIRYARLKPDLNLVCGLGVKSVVGVASFTGPATFQLAREADSVRVTTDRGLTLDEAWLGEGRRHAQVLGLDGRWIDVAAAAPGLSLPDALVREWSRHTERTLVDFRIDAHD